MLKKLFILLFTLLLSLNLFAENNDIYKQISDIRVEIEKIRNSTNKIDLKHDINKLEEKINKLDNEFNQNNIDKEKINNSFELNNLDIKNQNDRIDDINSHIDKLSIIVTIFGVLITVVLIIFSGTFFYVSNKKHLEKVDEWIEKNKDKILKPIDEEAKKIQRNIEDRAINLYREEFKAEKEKFNDYHVKLTNHASLDEKLNEKQVEIITKVNEILDNREKDEYTYADWYSKYLSLDNKKKYTSALKFLDKALNCASTDDEVSQVLFDKALTYHNINNNESLLKSREIYDEIIEKFSNSLDHDIQIRVNSALYNKALILSTTSNEKEALNIYNDLIKDYNNSNNSFITPTIVKSLINKFELNVLFNYDNTIEDEKLFYNISKDDKKRMFQFEMLKIFKNSKIQKQEKEIRDLKEKYSDITLDEWSFVELESWANSLDGELKNRVLEYIDIFKNHIK